MADDVLHTGSGQADLPERAVRDLLRPLGEVEALTPLTGGMFATTLRADLAGRGPVVVKTAPADEHRLLTYERHLLRTEAQVYRAAEPHPDLLMPQVLLTDFSRDLLPGDVVVATWADGVPAETLPDLAARTAAARTHRVGRLLADLHHLRGDAFGYPQPETGLQGDTWAQAFTRIVEAVLEDGRRWQVDLPDEQVRRALREHRGVLGQVTEPHLVHADLWLGNMFVDPATGDLTGVVDPERAFFGDPLFDIVGAEAFNTGEPGADLVAGYRQAGGHLPLDTEDGRLRLAFCRLYMALLMLVEVVPRGYHGPGLTEHLGHLDRLLDTAMRELTRP